MTRMSKDLESRRTGLPLLPKGRAIPAAALRRLMAEKKRRLVAEFTEKLAIRREAAKHSAILRKSASAAVSGTDAARAATGLRNISQRLAKRKVAAPVVPMIQPGTLPGQYVVRVPPPYYFAESEDQALDGDPTIHTSTDPMAGQMSMSVVTNFKSPSFGYACTEVGLCFSPPIGPATLTVWTSPLINFSAWVNAIGATDALVGGGISLGMAAYAPDGSINTFSGYPDGLFSDFDHLGLDFDFGSTTATFSGQVDVGTEDVCYVCVDCACVASAQGWPVPIDPRVGGSLAGMSVAVTVPFFILDFQLNPVIER